MNILDVMQLENVTCLYGEAGTGKTNIAILVAAIMAENGKVLFIDAENSFSPQRALEFNPKTKLENIIIIKPTNFFHQHKAIFRLLKVKCKLVIVDSINKFYRKRIKVDERTNSFFAKQLSVLNSLSKEIPVIITAQVYSIPQGTFPVGGNLLKNFCHNLYFLQKQEKWTISREKPTKERHTFDIKTADIPILP